SISLLSIISTMVLLLLPHSHPLPPYTTLFRSSCLPPGIRPTRWSRSQSSTQSASSSSDRTDSSIAVPTCATSDHAMRGSRDAGRSEEHTSELQSRANLVCRLLLEKKTNEVSYM